MGALSAEPDMAKTIDVLSSSGAPLQAEMRDALVHSIPLKKAESGLDALYLWGRVIATGGRDYVVAEGFRGAAGEVGPDGKLRLTLVHCVTQDGVNWADLPAPLPTEAAACRALITPFTGDGAFVCRLGKDGLQIVPSGDDDGDAADDGGGDDAAGADGAERSLDDPVRSVPELLRLKCLCDAVNAECGAVPVGALVEDADRRVRPSLAFRPAAVPEALEAWSHRLDGPSSKVTLADDPVGSWAVRHDALLGRTEVRSTVWLGYRAFVCGRTGEWGGLSVGSGTRNNDLVFML